MSNVPKKGKLKLYRTSVLFNNKSKKESISLSYNTNGVWRHVDLLALRPDPVEYLKSEKIYEAFFYFDSVYLCSLGKEIEVLRKIKVPDGIIFVNIR